MKQAEAAEKKALSGKIVFMLCVLISHLEDEKTQVQIGKINIDERGDEVKETLRIILRGFINAEPEIQKQILSDGASSDLMNQFIVDYIQRGRQFGLFAGETAGGKENNV